MSFDRSSVAIDLKELGGGADVEMYEILPGYWNLKPIFTQKWASVDMGVQPPGPNPDSSNFQPWLEVAAGGQEP